MIVGIGIDIVEIDRFKKARKKWGKGFVEKIFTGREIAYSRKRRFSDQHFAARFAAKEAVFKAFGDDRGSIYRWTDIEIVNDPNGKPIVMFHKSAEKLRRSRKVKGVFVSMAHSDNHAVANAVLTTE
ncbi:MAG: holo-ACP synthase [Candidatus Omnitrophica bacterium]|nr:holo-ACP synthase [Candidatus Omnitrophota bacterium]